MDLKSHVTEKFIEQYGSPPDFIVRAPGRINLIGEHTDYSLGYSLPMAIDRAMWIALRPRPDRTVFLRSMDYEEPAEFSLDEIRPVEGWADYVRGMTWALQDGGFPLVGWEGVLASDIPIASGLSSSAAIELVVGRAFWALTRWAWEPMEMARTGKKFENEWKGLQSGILDQMISALGREGAAFLLDFKHLAYEQIPFPEGAVMVVLNTKVKRGLVDSAYNDRVAECRQASEYFGVRTLREVSEGQFFAREAGLESVLRRRARHVVTENARTLRAADLLKGNDVAGFGELMNESHTSLRDDYEVSCRELDLMADLANEVSGCYGARMTGGGFGGCAIALVESGAAETLARQVAAGYEKETGIEPEVYICQPAAGADIVYP